MADALVAAPSRRRVVVRSLSQPEQQQTTSSDVRTQAFMIIGTLTSGFFCLK
jgi:hypothetical protein